MPDVHAEFEDGYWRVVDSEGRRYSISPIAGFKQQGGRFVAGKGDVTAYGWDDMTRMPDEWTAQLVAGALQLWQDECSARERAANRRANAETKRRMSISAKKFTIDINDDNGRVRLSHKGNPFPDKDSVLLKLDQPGGKLIFADNSANDDNDVANWAAERMQSQPGKCDVVVGDKRYPGSISVKETDDAVVLNIRINP